MNLKQSLLLLLALTWATGTQAQQAKRQTVASNITHATVFVNGAQVTRKAEATLSAGKTELVFAGISPRIDKQSIQVKGEGAFTILSVIHQTNYLNEQQRREEIQVLENKQEGLRQKLKVEKGLLAVFKNEEAMLVKNQSIGGSQTGVKTSELREAVDFQRARLREVLLTQIEIEGQIHKLDSSILQIGNQLKALNQSKALATSEVLVTVSAPSPVGAAFELSYLVQEAGWFAHYDLRVKDVESPIDLSLKANLFQRSGEDWKDVKLTISNGDPSESGIAPTLQPWHLRFGFASTDMATLQSRMRGMAFKGNEVGGRVTEKSTGEPLPGASVLVKGTTVGTTTDLNGYYALRLPEGAQLLQVSYTGFETQEVNIHSNLLNVTLETNAMLLSEVVVTGGRAPRARGPESRDKASTPLETTERYQPTTLTFEIDVPYTVLADGKVYTADIKSMPVPAHYEYFAVPKIEEAAYLTAKITDWQDLNLLEGEANLFFEGAFLGKSILDVRNAGDTLQISLGKDKSIVIGRKKLTGFSSRQFLSSYKTDTRAYEISVRNNKPQPIKIVVQDQFPISTTKEITVDEQGYEDGQLDKDTKIITWAFGLSPKQERKHLLKYAVKYPRNQVLVLD